MSSQPIRVEGDIYLEADASENAPREWTAAERRTHLAMLKKHSPWDYAWYLEQQKLRKKPKDGPTDSGK